MKKIVLCLMAMLASFSHIAAQAKADIKFDKTTHDFGTMPVDTFVAQLKREIDERLIAPEMKPQGGAAS